MTPEQFDQEFGPEFAPRTTPYGNYTAPVKPGLTKRGKVAVTVAAIAVAGTGFFWHEANSAEAAKNAKETAALQIQMKKLDIEQLREINKAAAVQNKEKTSQDTAHQKAVDACIQADKGLVGKQMGVTYRSVVADCQDQFDTFGQAANGTDMAEAGSASSTGNEGGGINSSGLLAIAGGAGLLVVMAASRLKKTHGA